MPSWLRRFLKSRSLKSHFLLALGLGLLARALCAFFVYGPQALDDYKHGVWPAYQQFAGLPLDLPDYRSHLLHRTLAVFLEVGSWFGVSSALNQVRVMYLGLALISLLAILGTYLYGREFKNRKISSSLALYLIALYPLMPFVSTRAFGEAVSLSLVVLSFGLLEANRRRGADRFTWWFAGFLILGLATLYRFHVGVLFVLYGLTMLVTKRWKAVAAASAAGLSTLLLQSWIDLSSGKPALGTLFSYLQANEGGAAQYGVSPWYNHVLLVLGLAFVPFSIGLFRYARSLWNQFWPLIFGFAVFLFIHSVVPHKEERFMYPVLGIELWFIAFLWTAGMRDKWVRKLFAPVALGLTAVLLPVFCFMNTQAGEIEPPALIEKRYGGVVYLDHKSLFGMSRFRFYFLRPPSRFENVEREDFNAAKVDQAFADNPGLHAVVLLTSDPEAENELLALERLKTMNGECLEVRTSGSAVDRLIYTMNPKHNQRRRPTWYLVCERGSA